MNSEKGELIAEVGSEDHCFVLKRLESTTASRVISVNFSPLLCKQSSKAMFSFPTFNNDKKCYMPSFILPIQEETIRNQERLYAALHYRKLQEANQEKEQMYVPKPSKKNSCCCICKVYYEDYLTHVNSPDHINSMHKSPFNQHIKDLCDMFYPLKKNILLNENNNSKVNNLNQKPRKKRKTQNVSKNQSNKKEPNALQDSTVSTMIESLGISNNNQHKPAVLVEA